MRRFQLCFGLGVLCAALMTAPGLRAETTTERTTTTTTTSSEAGTISSLTPGAIVIRSHTTSTPTTYTSTKTTTYVDEAGEPVAAETVQSGVPVTVYYDDGPSGLVASKVVVRKRVDGNETTTTIEKRETTTVTP